MTLTTVTLEASYKVPIGIGLPRLKAIFSAKLSAAEGHVWASERIRRTFLIC